MLIEFKNISVVFGNFVALENINCCLPNQAITTLVGPNGAGKSTLLKILLGLIKPTTGKVHKPKDLKISYVPQKLHINSYLPLPVLRLLTLNGKNKTEAKKALIKVKAEYLFENDVHSLSGGQLQRVLLARAILSNPKLMVLDEPAQGIDSASCTELYQIIADIRKQLQCTVFMVSHDLPQSLAISDHVICLNKHICCQGKGHEIHQHHAFASMFGVL